MLAVSTWAGALSVASASGATVQVQSASVRQGATVTFCGTVAKGAQSTAAPCPSASKPPSAGSGSQPVGTDPQDCTQVALTSSLFAGSGPSGATGSVHARVQADGSFSDSFDVPVGTPVGGYTVAVSCASSPSVSATILTSIGVDVQSALPLSNTAWPLAQFIALGVLLLLIPTTYGLEWLWILGSARGKPKNQRRQPRTLRGIAVGFDNRLSTSKVIALLWTVTVAYFVLTLTIIAVHRGTAGLWTALIDTFTGTYLVLLGGPFAAAVGAKLVVSARTPQNVQKSKADHPSLFDIISGDDSRVDLVDTQYTLFNLVALAAVLVLFIRRPGAGVPDVPSLLAVLTGAAAGTYLVNKGTQTNAPAITGVQPTSAAVGDTVTVSGANLLSPGGKQSNVTLSVGGFSADGDTIQATETQVTFTVPAPSGGRTYPTPARIVLTTDVGATVTTQDLPTELTVVTPAVNSLATQRVPRAGRSSRKERCCCRATPRTPTATWRATDLRRRSRQRAAARRPP